MTWPLELPVILIALLILPRRLAQICRYLLVFLLVALTALRLADMGSRLAFGRDFDPLAELHLMSQGWVLASQTVGRLEAALVVFLVLITTSLLFYMLNKGLASLQALVLPTRQRAALFALVISIVGFLWYGIAPESHSGLRMDIVQDFTQRADRIRWRIGDQLAFSKELAVDPVFENTPKGPTFAALEGRDLITLFVESYGRSWIDHERFRSQARQRLSDVENVVNAAGLSIRSAWVDSPIRGGRSWLAQASYASGLMLTSQARFDRLLSSDRVPLYSLLRNAGWTSVVALPVVSKPWIEGAWYDVDQFLNRDALGYQGKGFGYVTMPDQYTLSAFEDRVRHNNARPVAGMIGLLDSHAPWGPLPLPVPWGEVGDGSIFDGSNRAGEPVSWATPAPVRANYSQSLDQLMARLAEYLAIYADDALFVILGDHQPASVIAGWAPNAHVPMHIVSRDPELLARLPEASFTSGAIPGEHASPIAMGDVRALLSSIFEN